MNQIERHIRHSKAITNFILFIPFQHYLIMFGATVANPMVMTEPLCIDKDDTETKAQLMGTIFVVAGICTILQATVGVR